MNTVTHITGRVLQLSILVEFIQAAEPFSLLQMSAHVTNKW